MNYDPPMAQICRYYFEGRRPRTGRLLL